MSAPLCIVEFHRPEIRLPTFAELIGALLTAASSSGRTSYYRPSALHPEAINLVFGAHRILQAGRSLPKFSPRDVLVNLEPLQLENTSPPYRRYLELLSRMPVVDYCPSNVRVLAEMGNTRVHRFGFGFIPLSPFSFSTRENYLLFYGAISERRKRIAKALIQRKIPLLGLTATWGVERDYAIATAGAVININKEQNGVLEIYRLWHSLCLGTPVISERGSDTALTKEWEPFVEFHDDLEKLAPATVLSKVIPATDYQTRTSFHSSATNLWRWLDAL